jgi:hypothetical protein
MACVVVLVTLGVTPGVIPDVILEARRRLILPGTE